MPVGRSEGPILDAKRKLDEEQAVFERYRKREGKQKIYDPLSPYVLLSQQERERKIVKLINYAGLQPLNNKRVLEIGCGNGINLLRLMSLGFTPENLFANELQEERAQNARRNLPAGIKVIEGNALDLDLKESRFEIIVQFLVFSSILDKQVRSSLAEKMWQMLSEKGGILWYDFMYDNPWNKDVKGVKKKEIRQLFPKAEVKIWNVTLAPPVGRKIINRMPFLYDTINLIPLFRTHLLCWISK